MTRAAESAKVADGEIVPRCVFFDDDVVDPAFLILWCDGCLLAVLLTQWDRWRAAAAVD